jgi:hypothetical protein
MLGNKDAAANIAVRDLERANNLSRHAGHDSCGS